MASTTFPEVFPPSEVNLSQVVAAFINPSRAGEVPNGEVIAIQSQPFDEERPYVVWQVALKGDRWDAGSGTWDLTLKEALEEFTHRAHRFRAQG
jgi:hypothetical protein